MNCRGSVRATWFADITSAGLQKIDSVSRFTAVMAAAVHDDPTLDWYDFFSRLLAARLKQIPVMIDQHDVGQAKKDSHEAD